MANKLKEGQTVWFGNKDNIQSGVIRYFFNDKFKTAYAAIGMEGTVANKMRRLKELYPSKEELIAAHDEAFNKKVEQYCYVICNIDCLLQACYDRIPETDAEWRKTIKIKAKELAGVDLID